ncbi:MAG: hypothetical protein M1825_003370 [Sarcosagium campestre]|nr:MAG: hypothetical protein M1825_003370 [Sarcosagium campestre]
MRRNNVRSSVPLSAFEVLVKCFEESSGQTIEIEILPRDFKFPDGTAAPSFGVLFEPGYLGIRKDDLVQAFFKSQSTFFEGNARAPDGTEFSNYTFTASQIFTLFDPEFITAANYRKRCILNFRFADGQDSWKIEKIAKTEFGILNSLLTSDLPRHNKSPTLWYHRRWIIATLWPRIFKLHSQSHRSSIAQPDFKWPDFLKTELKVVCTAGRLHSPNYYAYNYARWIYGFVKGRTSSEDPLDLDDLASSSSKYILDQCLQRPTDVSIWSFLLFLFRAQGYAPSHATVLKQVLDRVLHLQWRHETIWLFVRAVMADVEVIKPPERSKIMDDLRSNETPQVDTPPADDVTPAVSNMSGKPTNVSYEEFLSQQLRILDHTK